MLKKQIAQADFNLVKENSPILGLLPDTGKLTAIRAADIAIKNPELIPAFLNTAFAGLNPLSIRAANTIEIIDLKRPDLIKPYYKQIITGFPNYKVDGVRRLLMKIFTRNINLEEDVLCRLLNFCFDCLSNPKEAVGVKVYSIVILYKISNLEPDIKNELSAVISSQIQESAKAVKSIGSKTLLKLKKEIISMRM